MSSKQGSRREGHDLFDTVLLLLPVPKEEGRKEGKKPKAEVNFSPPKNVKNTGGHGESWNMNAHIHSLARLESLERHLECPPCPLRSAQ